MHAGDAAQDVVVDVVGQLRVDPGVDVGVEHLEEVLEAALGGLGAEVGEGLQRGHVGVEVVLKVIE